MAFRDDRDALRARNEALESDLGDAQKRLDEAVKKLAEHESKDQRDERELKTLRREVNQLRSRLGMSPKPNQSRNVFIVLVGIATAGIVAGFIFVTTGASVKDDAVAVAEAPAAAVAEPVVAAIETTPLDSARFGAEVVAVEGLPLTLGSPCLLEARLGAGPSVEHVMVICGEQLVYESTMEGGMEMTNHESNAREIARAQAFVYVLDYRDTGQRSGPRPQLLVRGRDGVAELTRDSNAPFNLTLRIDDHSYPRFGPALGAPQAAPAGEGFRLRATPTNTTGPAPTIPEEGCEVLAHPDSAGGSLNCRVLVRCGTELLYGAGNTGYNTCTMDQGTVDAANDEGPTSDNSDPILRMDRTDGWLLLADDGPGGRWQIDFSLEQDPRCELSGMWAGNMVGTTGMREGISLVENDDELVLVRALADSAAIATGDGGPTVDCLLGEASFTDDAGNRWEGTFGPGFGSLVGRVRGGEPTHFWLLKRPNP